MYKATLSFTTKNYDVRKNQILAEDFTTQSEIDEYLSIGYIVEYDGTLEITQNGLYDVEDYEQANVDVPSGEPTLQSKSVTITTNTTTNIQADEGYDGLSSVAVTTNVGGKTILPDGIRFYNSTCADMSWLENADTSQITNLGNVFAGCLSLTYVPTIDTSNVTSAGAVFNGSTSIETLPNLDLSKVTYCENFANSCVALKNVPVYNLQSVTNARSMRYMFTSCPNLTDESLNNIMETCISTNIVTYPALKTLNSIGITSAQATRCQSLSNYDAFIAAGWTTGY